SIGSDVYTRTVQGVAPRANVNSYLVCFPTCPQTSSVAAVNLAIADGVDVLNYSISGSDTPWNDLVSQAFLDAFAAGVYVSAAAGNTGPGAATVNSTGPWNAAVAARTTNRIIAQNVTVLGPTPVPPGLLEVAAAPPVPSGTPLVADLIT